MPLPPIASPSSTSTQNLSSKFSQEEASGLGHLSHEREVLRLDLQGQMERVCTALHTARSLQASVAEWATQDRALVSNF